MRLQILARPALRRSRSPSIAADARGERPPKRRHLETGDRAARRYLDLEAEHAEDADGDPDEDGSDTEMIDFLDASPLTDLPAYRAPRSRSPEDNARELWAIAEAIRERARLRTLRETSPSIVPRLRSLTAPGGRQHEPHSAPIPYLVSMQANAPLEQKLIRWLQGSVPGVVSVVSHELGSGRLYVTARDYACLELGLREWPLSWNLSQAQRRPLQMTAFEYQWAMERLRARQAEVKPGTWARIATDLVTDTGFISLAGDLVLLLDHALALSVPRVPSGIPEERAADVPPRLCFPAALVEAFPHTKARIITEPGRQCWKWGGRCFRDSGLEVFTVDAADITMNGVEPTEEERKLFASSGDPLLCRPSLAHPAWALQAGDRVVFRVSSKVIGGHIQCITQGVATVLLDEPSPKPEIPAPVSKNVPILDVARTANPGHERAKCLRVPVDQMRLHLLATPRTLSLGDRVLVVAGPHIGSYGHIMETVGPRMLSIETFDDGLAVPIFVDRQHVQVCFRLGDAVEVLRGGEKGVTGLIVAVYHASSWPCTTPVT